jgi:hypothetical protein
MNKISGKDFNLLYKYPCKIFSKCDNRTRKQTRHFFEMQKFFIF